MPGTMSQADLAADLKGMLKDAANKFTGNANEDFYRHLTLAAQDLARIRPRVVQDSLTLVADQTNYPAPSDLIAPLSSRWGHTERSRRKPWDANWPAPLPRLGLVEAGGARELVLDPPPTQAQITDLGATYYYTYRGTYTVAPEAANTTVPAGDRHILLMRALAAALFELAANGISKPVQLGTGVGSMPKNGSPAALAEMAMQQVEVMAA